jgi:iron complex outermembrane recepter protein
LAELGDNEMNANPLGLKALRWGAMSLVSLLFAGEAVAQSSSNELEQIVVTAQKKEESLQSAAVSVTVLKGNDIGNFGVTDPDALQSQMPGVQFMNSDLTNTIIRGVGTYNNQPNVDAAVAWNIDGAYAAHQEANPPILFDIDRIEVLRGPQGTLYGRNSNGGSINVITGAPVLGEFQEKISVGAGNFDSKQSEFVINLPVAEYVAVRAAFASDFNKGYYQDGSDSKDNYAGRVRVLYEPSDRFNIIATGEWSSVHDGNEGLSYCPPVARASVPACQSVAWVPYQGYGLPGNFDKYGTGGPIGMNPGFVHRDNDSFYVEWNYKWDLAALTSISNWHKYQRQELEVWDFESYSPLHDDRLITQEFRLASVGKSRLDWVAGLYYSNEHSNGLERFGTQIGAPNYQTFQEQSDYGVQGGVVTSEAAFGQVTYSIIDPFRVKGGLRYTNEKKALPGSAGADLNTADPVIVQTGATLKTDKLTWLAGTEYDVAKDNMLYAKVSTGFKSGTVNAVPAGIGVPPVTSPEQITAYEIGSKNRFLDNRLEVNAEAFHYTYTGYQTVIVATDPTGFFPGNFFPSVNSQKARFDGGEIESHYKIEEHTQFDLALSVLTAKHTEFVTPTFDWSGHRVEDAPPKTIIAGLSHDFLLPNGGSLIGKITTNLVAGYFNQDSNLPGTYTNSYTNTSAFLTYKHPLGHWSITGWVRNLENYAVINVAQGQVERPGFNVFLYPPREYGFTLKYEM